MQPSTRTRLKVAGVLTRVLKWAKREGLTREDMSGDMLKAWGGSVQRQTLIPSIPQVEALAAALDDFKPGLGDVCTVLAFTGMRWEELVYVPLEAVDLESQRIRIAGTASESGGRREVRHFGGKTAAAVRTIVIPDLAMPAVQRLHARAQQGQRQARAERVAVATRFPSAQPMEPGVQPFARLVNGERGGYLSYNGMWRRYLAQAHALTEARGEPVTYTAHELRHVAASILVGTEGASADLIARQMGHKSVEFTKRVYAHLFEQDHDVLLRALNARIATLHVAEAQSTAA